MKHILLATTALAMSAGAAAADVTTSATATLSYGNFGTGTYRAGITDDSTAAQKADNEKAPDAEFGVEADFVVSMSGEDAGIAYSASLTIDETEDPVIGEVSVGTNGLTLSYHKNSYDGLTSTGGDGEADNDGDVKLAYSGNGITASYEVNTDKDNAFVADFGYTISGVTLGVQSKDADGTGSAKPINKFSLGYTMGDLTLKYSADDQNGDDQDWDASVAYKIADTTLTLHTDETNGASLKVETKIEGLSLTARYEVDGNDPATDSSETELTLGYSIGDLALSLAYDSGDDGKFGDEAQTVVSATYTVGGLSMNAKANDQNEYEVSTGFTF